MRMSHDDTAGTRTTTKTVTTINLCQSTFNKFIIVTPAVCIDRDGDGAGDTLLMEELNGLERTIAMVRDENNNNRSCNNGSAVPDSSSYSWNQWWCSLVYSAVRCFGTGSATAAGATTTKLLQPCQYRRGRSPQMRYHSIVRGDMNNNGFYSRRSADGTTYEL